MWIYVVLAPSMQAVKIGCAEDVDRRIRELQCGCPEPLQKLVAFPGGRDDEAALHAHFADSRLHREWFRYDGAVARFVWDMGDQNAPIPNPLPSDDAWHAINRFDDRPVRLRRILKALASRDIDLEELVEPPRRHYSETIFHALLLSFLAVEHDFDDNKTLSRLYQFTHDIDFLVGWMPDRGSLKSDAKLRQVVQVFQAHPASALVRPFWSGAA